jgi:hypothetical protein
MVGWVPLWFAQPSLLVPPVGCQGGVMVVGVGPVGAWGGMGALRCRGVSADAQPYFGTRLGLATGSET